ncbi:MAG TPA: hypothetical protein VGD95_08090 [Micavibrio sp.]
MNVYMLTANLSPDTIKTTADIQKRFENAFRKALKGSTLVTEFSRVSPPDQTNGQMAVVCTENVAQVLRTRADLGVQALELDQGRTHRRQMAYGNRA